MSSKFISYIKRPVQAKAWIPQIDGLRFLAILPVVFQHLQERCLANAPAFNRATIMDQPFFYFISRGTVGVFLFFAISGFVVAMPFARHYLSDAPKPSVRAFFLRRLTRIEPPYLIWLTLFAAVLAIKGTLTGWPLLKEWLMGITYSHNLWAGQTYPAINPVTWSLEIEIQFYLLSPFLAGLYFSRKNPMHRRLALGAFWLVLTALQFQLGWWKFPVKTTLLGHLQHFLVGFLALDFYITHWKNQAKRTLLWDFIGVASIFIMAYTWSTEFGKNLLFAPALFCLIAAAFKGKVLSYILKNNWLTAIGGMCYTIYLIHLPLLELQTSLLVTFIPTHSFFMLLMSQVLIALPLVLVVGTFFYLVIERPFMTGFSFNVSLPTWSFAVLPVQIKAHRFFPHRRILPVLALLLPLSAANAQVGLPHVPPLDSLVMMAEHCSPEIAVFDLAIKAKEKERDVKSADWADLLSFSTTALWGNSFLNDLTQTTTSSEFIGVNRKSGFYNAGVSLKITLGDVVNRRKKDEVAAVYVLQSRQEKAQHLRELKEEVIRRYDRFQLAVELLQSESDNVQALTLALEVAEKYYKEGNYPVNEYTTALAKKAVAEKLFIQAKAEAKNAYRMLASITCLP